MSNAAAERPHPATIDLYQCGAERRNERVEHVRTTPIRAFVCRLGVRLHPFGTLLAVALLIALVSWRMVPAAAGASIVVREPTISGPSQTVHVVPEAGLENTTLYWATARGLEHETVNSAIWEATVSPGIYAVEIWLPKGFGDAFGRYAIAHDGQADEVRLRQSMFGNEWSVLGTFVFDGPRAVIESPDSAGKIGEEIAWSSLRLTPVAEVPPTVEVVEGATVLSEPKISGPEGFVTRFAGVGYHGQLLRAIARGVQAAAVNRATWSAPLGPGTYALEIFVPREHAEAVVSYDVHSETGEKTISVDQSAYSSDLWVPLGTFAFAGDPTITSSDATGTAGDELAWSGARFTPMSTLTETGAVAVSSPNLPTGLGGVLPSEEERIAKPACANKSAGRAGANSCGAREPLVAMQKGLVEFKFFRIDRGPEDVYEVFRLYPTSKDLKLKYRCIPCLALSYKETLLPRSHMPVLQRTRASGDLRRLLGRRFYKGTKLQITVGQKGHRALHYTYRLTGDGKVACKVKAKGRAIACAR